MLMDRRYRLIDVAAVSLGRWVQLRQAIGIKGHAGASVEASRIVINKGPDRIGNKWILPLSAPLMKRIKRPLGHVHLEILPILSSEPFAMSVRALEKLGARPCSNTLKWLVFHPEKR